MFFLKNFKLLFFNSKLKIFFLNLKFKSIKIFLFFSILNLKKKLNQTPTYLLCTLKYFFFKNCLNIIKFNLFKNIIHLKLKKTNLLNNLKLFSHLNYNTLLISKYLWFIFFIFFKQKKQSKIIQQPNFLFFKKETSLYIIDLMLKQSQLELKISRQDVCILFFKNFLINFLNFLFKSCVIMHFFFLNNKVRVAYFFKSFFKKVRVLSTRQKYSKFLYFLIQAILILFITKDIIFFKNWICNFFELIPPRLHRKFLSKIYKLFKYYLHHFFLITGCVGFKLLISGKISVTGNAKTRSYQILFGKTSFSNKKLKIAYEQGRVRTLTGVLGLHFLLAYN